jgi:hypothetical protein
MKGGWLSVSGWVWFALLSVFCTGCAVFTVDSIQESEDRTRKNAFLMTFNAAQAIRRETGIPLMDWCSECYRFDHEWALSVEACRDRIRRFEKGDTTALHRSTMLPP